MLRLGYSGSGLGRFANNPFGTIETRMNNVSHFLLVFGSNLQGFIED